ncbi:MAG: hypothetical protein SOZ62_03725 [Eubacteriales bacterium]|nr:hypothetical protein [Eubacteriales bacterium]
MRNSTDNGDSDADALKANAAAVFTLDVNPGVRIYVIVACLSTNEDAKAILAGLKLECVDMNTALTAIVGSMYMNGYLTEDSNSILISVNGKDEETTDILLSDITSKINTVFENSGLECSIIAQSVKVDDDLKHRAQENGVSVGKMHLVDKMVGEMDDFCAEDAPDLADMSIKELNLIYSSRPNKGDENDPFKKDISSGEVGGFIKQDDALTLLLEEIELDKADIKWYWVQVKLHNRKMVYSVYIRVKDDATTYEFEVDCRTGEVVKIDNSMPNIKFPGINGGAPQAGTLPGTQEKNDQGIADSWKDIDIPNSLPTNRGDNTPQ